MADRYWVGGAGTWNATNTANWSNTSGGAGGFSVPTEVDDVYFNAASNDTGYAVTISSNIVSRSLFINGPLTGSVTFSGGSTWQIYGNIFFATSGVVLSTFTGAFQALSKIPTTTINTNGVVIGASFTVGNAGYSPTEAVVWDMQSAYSSTGNFIVNTGTFNTNGYSITCANFTLNSSGSSPAVRFSPGNTTLTLTGIAITLNSGALLSDLFNLTLTNSVSTVNVTANSKGFKTFTIAGTGTNTVTFTGTCFIETFQHTRTSAYTISFNTGANLTVQNWKISGAFGAVVAVQLVSTGLYFLNVIKQDAVDYLRISSCISDLTTPAPPFYVGANSTTLGGNGSAIILAALPTPTTYYWVGGSATWNATNTLPWSLSSGGTGSAGVPTAYDNVVFDSNSGGGAYSVSITTNVWANNITAGGTALIFPNFSGGGVNLKGSFSRPFAGTNVATGFFIPSGTVATCASATTFPAFRLYGAGTVQLQSAITVPNAFTGELRAGTLDLNNYSFTCSPLQITTVQVKTWMLTNSAVTTNIVAQGDGSCGLTISTGTSTVNINTASVGISISGSTTSSLQLHNVSFSDSNGTSFGVANAPITINNLTLPGTAADNTTGGVTVNLRQLTINGTLTIPTTSTPRYRNFFGASPGNGGQISNIFLANTASVARTTFFGVNFTGPGAPVTGAEIGDSSGNSGIVFTAPKTVYLSSTGSPSWSSSPFATTSGGATAAANYPLPQDTVIIDNSSAASGGSITAANFAGQIDASARSNPATISALTNVAGNLTLSSSMTISGTVRLLSFPSAVTTFTQNGATFTGACSLTNGASVLLGSAASVGAFSHFSGILNINGYTFSANSYAFPSQGGLYFGAGSVALRGSGTISSDSTSGVGWLEVTGSRTVNVTYSGAAGVTVGGSFLEFNALDFNYTTGTYTLTDSSARYRNLNLTGFAGTFSNSARTIFGGFNAGSTATLSAGASTTTFAATSGTWGIAGNGRTLDFPLTFNGVGGTWQLQDAVTVGATRTTNLTNGTFDLNGFTYTTGLFSSSGSGVRTIAFGTSQISLSGNNATIWDNNTATNFAFTGTFRVVTTYTGGVGTRTINQGFVSEALVQPISTTGISGFILDTSSTDIKALQGSWNNFDMTGVTGTMSNTTIAIYGNFNVGSTATLTAGGSQTIFASTVGVKTITSNGRTLDFPLTFNGVGGTWQLADALTMGTSRAFTLTNGAFDANNYNVTTGTMSSTNSNIRTLALGSGTWTIAGTGASAWTFATSTNATITGTAIISMTGATAKTFAGGALTWPTLNQGGAGALTIVGNNTFTNITSTRTAAGPCAITFTAGSTQSVSNFTASGTAIGQLTLGSTTTSPYNLVKLGGGDVNVSFCTISYSNASP